MAARKLFYTVTAGLILAACFSMTLSAGNVESSVTAKKKEAAAAADYSGVYKITDPSVCSLSVTITRNDSGYFYTIDAAGDKSSGELNIENESGDIYLNFTSTLRSGDEQPVTGIYSENSIIIQNYGNAMNSYTCFEKCDAKYLKLVKIK